MFEVVGNMHVHTTYSDGAGPHSVVAAAAARAGLDFVVITDHNVRADGLEGLYRVGEGEDSRQVLLLMGEEVHDMLREPQRNHLLVYGAGRTLAPAGQGQPPQALLDAVRSAGGLAFLAHPVDVAVPWVGEGSYSWVDWEIEGYTGLELWNYMSGIKDLLTDPVRGIASLLAPRDAVTGPNPATLRRWDDLLRAGRRVIVNGSADAHAAVYRFGPLQKVIYPYRFLFRCVNTHLLLPAALTGDPQADAAAIYAALARGHAFVGYGLPGDPRGFRFEARRAGQTVAIQGDEVALGAVETLRVQAPAAARLVLLRDGEPVAEAQGRTLTFTPERAGAYRVEAWRRYRGRARGWVFSNPIFVLD
ncbi:MAG: PHP domain-containing protein [Anaerolineae bacterium]|nr:PHP domain-containing protein [Anaerolineae bacterium]